METVFETPEKLSEICSPKEARKWLKPKLEAAIIFCWDKIEKQTVSEATKLQCVRAFPSLAHEYSIIYCGTEKDAVYEERFRVLEEAVKRGGFIEERKFG